MNKQHYRYLTLIEIIVVMVLISIIGAFSFLFIGEVIAKYMTAESKVNAIPKTQFVLNRIVKELSIEGNFIKLESNILYFDSDVGPNEVSQVFVGDDNGIFMTIDGSDYKLCDDEVDLEFTQDTTTSMITITATPRPQNAGHDVELPPLVVAVYPR